jgi:hypothetical protein
VAAVLLRRSVAVHRATGRLTLRRPRRLEQPRLAEAEGVS